MATELSARRSIASDKLLLIGATNANAAAYTMLPENLSYEPYAIALPRGDWAFRVAVNKGLSQLYGCPQILDIHLKWLAAIGQSPDLLSALSPDSVAKSQKRRAICAFHLPPAPEGIMGP